MPLPPKKPPMQPIKQNAVLGGGPVPDSPEAQARRTVSDFSNKWKWLTASNISGKQQEITADKAKTYETERKNLPMSHLQPHEVPPHITKIARVARPEAPAMNYQEINKPKNTEANAPTIDYSKINKPSSNDETNAPTLNYAVINERPKPDESNAPVLDYSKMSSPKATGPKWKQKLEQSLGRLKTQKEKLNKTLPTEEHLGELLSDFTKTHQSVRPLDGEKHISSKKTNDGFYHHIFDTSSAFHPQLGDETTSRHILSASPNPNDEGLSHLYITENPEFNKTPNPQVYGVSTPTEHQGKGYGFKLYDSVINHYGKLSSGTHTSQQADSMWQKIHQKYPNSTNLSPKNTEGYHSVVLPNKSSLTKSANVNTITRILAKSKKEPLKKSESDDYGTLMEKGRNEPNNPQHVNDAAKKLLSEKERRGILARFQTDLQWHAKKNNWNDGLHQSFYNQVLTAAVKNHPDHPNAKSLVDTISRSTNDHAPLDAALAQSPHPKPGWLYEEDKKHLIPVEHLKEMSLDKDMPNSNKEDAMKLWLQKDPQNVESLLHRAALSGDRCAGNAVMEILPSVDDKLNVIKATGDAHTLGRLAESGEITPHQFANAFTSTMTSTGKNGEHRTLFQVPPEYVAETGKQVAQNPALTNIVMENPYLMRNLGHHLPDEHLYAEASKNNSVAVKFLKDNKPELMQSFVNRVNRDAQEFGHPNPETHKQAKAAIKKMKDYPELFKPSQETLAHLRNHPEGEKPLKALLLKTLKHAKKNTPIKNETVSVSLNTGKLRQARDMALRNDGAVHIQDLRKVGLDPAGLKIEHLKDNKGKIPAQAIQSVIDSIPKANFNVSTGVYKTGAQTHDTSQPSKVFRLDMSPEKKQELKDAGVYDQFKKIAELSKRSGHPVKSNTIGWVRYSDNADGFHMDEVQSDFGQSLAKQVSEIRRKQAAGESLGTDDSAIKDLDENQILKINDILFGKAHPSQLVHEGFLQSLRDSGHVGNKVHIWQTEPRSVIAGMNRNPEIASVSKDEAMNQEQFKYKYGAPEKENEFKNMSSDALHLQIRNNYNHHNGQLESPHFNDTHTDALISSITHKDNPASYSAEFARKFAAKLNPEHVARLAQNAIDRLKNSNTPSEVGNANNIASIAAKSPHLSQQHHDQLFEALKDEYPGTLSYSHRMKPEQATEMLNNRHARFTFLKNSPLINDDPSYIDDHVSHHHEEILRNPHLSDSTLQKLSRNPHVFKKQIINHPNASDETKSQLISGLDSWNLPDVLHSLTPKIEPVFLNKIEGGLSYMGTDEDSWHKKNDFMKQLGRKLSESPNLSHKALSAIESLGRKHLNNKYTMKDLSTSVAIHPSFPDELRMDKIKSSGGGTFAIEALPRHFVMSPDDISYAQSLQTNDSEKLSARLAKQPNFNESHVKKAVELGHLPYIASKAKPDADGKMNIAGVYFGMKKPDLPVHMREGYGDIPKKMGYKPAKYGDISTQANEDHEGSDTWAHTLAKSLRKLKKLRKK